MYEVQRTSQEVNRARPRPRALPDAVWAPLAGGILTLIPGLLGLWTGNVWLFPSLGPTAFLQAVNPQDEASRPHSIIVGHTVGIAVAFACVLLLGAAREPAVFVSHQLFLGRVLASAVGVALTILVQKWLKAPHPPAAATTLLITLGGFKPNLHDALALGSGIVLVAVAGEILRRVRLAQSGQKQPR